LTWQPLYTNKAILLPIWLFNYLAVCAYTAYVKAILHKFCHLVKKQSQSAGGAGAGRPVPAAGCCTLKSDDLDAAARPRPSGVRLQNVVALET
jgi:hypothetical protein